MTHSQYVVQPNAFLSIAEDTRTIVFCFLHSMSIERTHRMTQYLVTDGSYITMYFTALLHAVRPSRLRRAVHGSDHALTSYYIFLCVSFVRTEHANFYIKAKTTTPEIKRCGTEHDAEVKDELIRTLCRSRCRVLRSGGAGAGPARPANGMSIPNHLPNEPKHDHHAL